MSRKKRYVLDSDVLITAKNSYYAFSICPGFWQSVIQKHEAGLVCSVSPIKQELLAGNKEEDLIVWVKSDLPSSFFEQIDSDVSTKYASIMLWAQSNAQFSPAAKAKFARGADGWLVAFASVHAATVVTIECSAPQSKASIKIPDVCNQFNVQHTGPFQMLRALAVSFHCGKGS